jgi:hypothetical protein
MHVVSMICSHFNAFVLVLIRLAMYHKVHTMSGLLFRVSSGSFNIVEDPFEACFGLPN